MVSALVGLWSLTEMHRGPLMRMELRLDRTSIGQVHPDLLDAVVGELARRVRGSLVDSGASVESGCSVQSCTIAVEGLDANAGAARQALVAQLSMAEPHFSLGRRMALMRAWRERIRSDDAVVHATLIRSFSESTGLERWELDTRGERPHFSRAAVHDLWALSLAAPATDPAPSPRPDALRCSSVDDPSSRTWVAVAWKSRGEGDDLLRDALLVGDFESLAVQALREGESTFTYDVTMENGDGWTAGSFQTDAALAEAAAARLVEVVVNIGATDQEALRAAYRRLAARHAAVRDTLAGALAKLPELPPVPDAALPAGAILGSLMLGGPPVAGTCSRKEALLGR